MPFWRVVVTNRDFCLILLNFTFLNTLTVNIFMSMSLHYIMKWTHFKGVFL